jgi:hypothetical protein
MKSTNIDCIKHRWVPVGLVALMALALVPAETLPGQPGKSPVKVFILAGQSNMEGQGTIRIPTNSRNGEREPWSIWSRTRPQRSASSTLLTRMVTGWSPMTSGSGILAAREGCRQVPVPKKRRSARSSRSGTSWASISTISQPQSGTMRWSGASKHAPGTKAYNFGVLRMRYHT